MCNKYAYQVAKALIYPELNSEFAADVINGYVFGSDIRDEVCTLVGGWCNDTNVFVAWNEMGRPDEWEFLEPYYDMVRDPAMRRSMVANARISAMAECVADALYDAVNETVVNEGWKCVPASEINQDMHGIGWLEEGCDALDCHVESYLFKPNGK